VNLKKRMVTTMQHLAYISKLVFPQGLLGEIQVLYMELNSVFFFRNCCFMYRKHEEMKSCMNLTLVVGVGEFSASRSSPPTPLRKRAMHSHWVGGWTRPPSWSERFGMERNYLPLQVIEPCVIWLMS
jgi:hypothetical protein